MEKKNVFIKLVRSPAGYPVKRWCGSCAHKLIDKQGNRVCSLTMRTVEQAGRCRKWEMAGIYLKMKN